MASHRSTTSDSDVTLEDTKGSVADRTLEDFKGSVAGVTLEDIRGRVEEEDLAVDSYKDIETLWLIEQSPLHKLALKDWKRKEKDLNERATRRESKSQDLHTQIYNIIGWYAVFQGVVLTAVAQLTQTYNGSPVCGKTWFPIVLTGFGTVVTIVGVVRLLLDLQKLETTINSEKKAKQEVASRASILLRKGPKGFSFKRHTKDDQEYPDPGFRLEWAFVIVSLLVFTGIFILSYFVILCDTWVATKWNNLARAPSPSLTS